MKQPVTNYWSWTRSVPQILAILVLIGLAWPLFGPGEKHLAMGFGAGAYLLYSRLSKTLIASAHRRGLKFSADKNYKSAIQEFEKSYNFFARYPQIDRFRAVGLMSPSIWSYKEMALLNIANCYWQLGDVNMAKTSYERLLSGFPDNEYAINALRFIENAQATSDA